MTDEEADALVLRVIDLYVNPLAQVVTQLSATLVKSAAITKDEARVSIASAVQYIKPLPYPEHLKEGAASTLARMVKAIDSLPD
jgi:hypothetical protein